jgi:DNA-binding NarL/FixJ family response regulator
MAESERTRVLVADDHAFYREGVRAMLGALPGTEVVGEAATGEEAVARAAELSPDIIIMDLRMPGIDGITATRQILAQRPEIGVLVVTMFDDQESVFAAMRAGARGYLLKDATLDEFLRAVTAVRNGEAIFSPAIARRMIQYFGMPMPVAPLPFPELSERERQILTLIAQGLSNEAIATRLTLSLKTVRNHTSNILGKLQLRTRAEAAQAARLAGLGAEQPN